MKKVFKLLLLFLVIVMWQTSGILAKSDFNEKKIYFFYGIGCSHCAKVEKFFEENDLYDRYLIERREIYFDRDNAVLYNTMLDKLRVAEKERGVPIVILGDKVIVGDRPIIDNFENEAKEFLKDEGGEKIEGEVSGGANLTLLMVLGASLVDAINPCAFAVLIVLMSTVLASGQAKKALKAGLAFAASIFISYFLMGLGLYTALGRVGLSGAVMKIIGWLAVVLGLLNLKDWLWYGKGFLMEVPVSWRPNLKKLIRSVTSPLGAFMIGFLVSLFLLPCTSGPYVVILGMLAEKTLQIKAIGYLVLYNLVFVSPMILITWLVYKGFDPEKVEALRKKHLKNLHLIAGIILIGMGVVILSGKIR